jgi:uncharacterized membrane protein YfcA
MMDGVVERIGVFALVGLGSGFVSVLFGIGGGIVRIPLFVYLLPLFGVAQSVMMHVAVGTSMALGNLDLAFFRTWAVGILIGVLVGTALLPYASTERLQVIFAIFMVTVGVYEGFLKDRLVFARTPPQGAKKVGVASAIGCLAALTGTGGGTMATPILQAFSMKMQAAIAVSSATGLVSGTVATVGAIAGGWHALGLPSYSLGYVDLAIFAAMMPTIMIAAPVGVRVGHMLSETWLRRVYTVLLFVIAADLIRKLVV